MVAANTSPTTAHNAGALQHWRVPGVAEMWDVYKETLRPPERLLPSQFSEKHIVLSKLEGTEQPGPWRNDYFPYLAPIMDTVPIALKERKRGWVMMKSAQGGGSRAMINVYAWLQSGDYAGAMAYMISKDDLAAKFSMERIAPLIETCQPLKRKALKLARTRMLYKRFADGSLSMSGPAISNLQSLPFRIFFLDEVDSMMDELKDGSDPIKLAQQRMNSFFGPSLLLAFAHPSTAERGAANLFYTQSDQRRGYVKCPHCTAEFWLQWSHVKAIPKEGMNKQQAEMDPSCYEYFCPECAAQITDAHRIAMVRNVIYRSELPPAEAAKRSWIGVHFSKLYMPNHTLESIATEWCECKGEAQQRVFYNKTLGEPFETKIDKIEVESWRRLIIAPKPGKHIYRGIEFKHDPDAYTKGQVPPGVRFLTAGQDSRHKELHYSVWGWGLRRVVGMPAPGNVQLCGWLIDWNVVNRVNPGPTFTETEYHVFDDLLFRRLYPTTYSDEHFQVLLAGFDSGYAPTQIPIHAYCRWWPGRAAPVKGAALTATSASRANAVSWGSALKFRLPDSDIEVKDDSSRPLIINTYRIKMDLYGALKVHFKTNTCHGEDLVTRWTLPTDVDERFLKEMSAEFLKKDKYGHEYWDHEGDNHFADTTTYAMACALNLDPFQDGLPLDEAKAQQAEQAKNNSGYVPGGDDGGRDNLMM